MENNFEGKIKWLIDRAEIEALISAYANTLDDHDFAGWKDLFSDDGGYGIGAERMHHGILAKAAEDLLETYPHTHHFFGLPTIKIDGDVAEARCPGITHHVHVVEHPSQSNIVGGWLRLSFRRTEKGWRIVNAHAQVSWTEGGDYFAGASKIAEHLAGHDQE